MAREVTEKPADFCFPECPHMQLTIDVHMAYADDKVVRISNTEHCVHEDACKMWADELRKKLCPECDYHQDPCNCNPIVCYPVMRRKSL